MRVKLTVDLTNYDHRLTGGQEGNTVRPGVMDRFVWVRFDCGAYLEILWESLEIIDPEHLAHMKEAREREDAEAAKATDVVLRLGPNGGFRYLSYKSGNTHASVGFRDKADHLMKIMRDNGIPIREEREPRAKRW